MINQFLKYGILSLLAILLQGLIFNNIILLGGYGTPFIYISVLLILPLETPVWMLYLVGFFTGISIDGFTNTGGMHASAATALIFARTLLIKLLTPRDGYDTNARPSIEWMGLNWWLGYSGILILVHHLWLFSIEIFRFESIGQVIIRTFASAFLTLFVVTTLQYIGGRATKR